MKKPLKPYSMLEDFVTGKAVPNIGSEENRQAVERFLVEKKSFDKMDIEVDAEIMVMIDDTPYRSQIDLLVSVDGRRFMAVKCAAGSLGSWQREILSAARILAPTPLPLSVISDGNTAVLMDTVSGNTLGEGMMVIPSKESALEMVRTHKFHSLPENRLAMEKRIFRAYDMMNVNVRRHL